MKVSGWQNISRGKKISTRNRDVTGVKKVVVMISIVVENPQVKM